MIETAKLIQQFVTTLNERGLEPLFDREVPPELRGKQLSDISGMYEWRICSTEENPWVPPLEEKAGTAVFNELADVMFRDRNLSPTLMKNGLLQFGRQAGGGYDPICFDMKRRVKDDAPVVRIDHEDVLIRNRLRVLAEIAPTFEHFVEQVIAGRHSTR